MKQQVAEKKQQTNKKPTKQITSTHKNPPTLATPQQKTVQWYIVILSRNCGITAFSIRQRNAI